MERLRFRRMRSSQCHNLALLERHSDENFWRREDFERHLATKRCGGFVALQGKQIVGFVAYELLPKSGEVLIVNLVVHAGFRRLGIGRGLVAQVKSLLGGEFDSIWFNVRESNLDAQIFLQRLQFVARVIAEKYFVDHFPEETLTEHAYCFEFTPIPRRRSHASITVTTSFGTPLRYLCPSGG